VQRMCLHISQSCICVLLNCQCVSAAAVPWTSGVVYSDADKAAADAVAAAEEAEETKRLAALKNNATLPLLYFDVEVG